MCMARYLLALACIFSNAAPVSSSESSLEMEVGLARSPSLYLRLELDQRLLEVKVRGMVLDTHTVRAVRFVYVEPAGGDRSAGVPTLPIVVKTAGLQQSKWRPVVAPPTLVPYSETAEPPMAKPTATVPLPEQYQVELDSGGRLVVGPEPPYRFAWRLGRRLATGWRRLIGRSIEPPPPSLVIEMAPEDSRALVHLFDQEIPMLVTCGFSGLSQPTDALAAGN